MRIASLLLAVSVAMTSLASAADDEKGFVKITDGKSMKGWKANENKDSWSMKDGAFVAQGPRSHLFYVGDEKPFVNFELKVDVMTKQGSNGGIYFHTKYQESGWPKYGYESQVNNTHGDPRKTGSLYAVDDVDKTKNPAKDDKWWTQHIIVKGRNIVIKIDGKTVVNYTEAEDKQPGKDFTRKLSSGTFALQAHDPKSVVYFKNIRVKRLEP
jgi:hypothetical protein